MLHKKNKDKLIGLNPFTKDNKFSITLNHKFSSINN